MRDRTKTNARAKVLQAIMDGTLTRQPCEICGLAVVEAHHEDYDRPLDVRWLCKRHHREYHATVGDLGGRPPVNRPTGRKITLYMLPDVEAKARAIGAGNVSGGVATAVKAYEAPAISKTRKVKPRRATK